MNYTAIYRKLIAYRKQNKASGLVEEHHIVPRSYGGTDDPENLVNLTLREHYVCHKLLLRESEVEGNIEHIDAMTYAVWRMIGGKRNRYGLKTSSREYERMRRRFITAE